MKKKQLTYYLDLFVFRIKWFDVLHVWLIYFWIPALLLLYHPAQQTDGQ